MSTLTKKDFLSGVDPRWCPGCGCHSVLQRLMSSFAALDIPRENYALISGIGCSSRLPYYANTYGIHGIHGRAPTMAMGLKLSRPELSVWVVTGDGDALAIGGNHFMHLMRRNADIKVIMINNRIYGLTKGQASPTTAVGTKTKTTPLGSEEIPVKPLALAIAAGATFAARVMDIDGEMMGEVFQAAARHRGTAFIEVLVNCVIFNDGAFNVLSDKTTRNDYSVRLRHGQRLVFGTNQDKAIHIHNLKPQVVPYYEAAPMPELMIHDVHNLDSTPAYLLSQMEAPEKPMPFGIFRQVSLPVYGEVNANRTRPTDEAVERLFRSGGNTWSVDESGNIKALE